MRLVVHGGAGAEPADPAARQTTLDEAAATGVEAATPLDAVETALAVLEASPRFNAGVGGALQADGVVRTDAGVMTDTRETGAVCAAPGIARATAAARAVLERSPHVLVSGRHAVRLAEAAGVETGVDLVTPATRQRYEAADPPDAAVDGGDRVGLLAWVDERFGADDRVDGGLGPARLDDHDTVGAVAVDTSGSLAAATSTGGRWFAYPGRVGDSPLVGSGFYAGPAGGASATGHGEAIAKVTLSRLAVDRLAAGANPKDAADNAVTVLDDEVGGNAGIIVADRRGRLGWACNTDRMQTSTAER